MRTQNESVQTHAGTIRAGVISLLIPTVTYLWVTGISDLLTAWLFMAAFAVCFVLMLQSIVELMVLAFCYGMKLTGAGVGRWTRVVRRLCSQSTRTA